MSDPSTASYAKLPRSTVNRYKARGRYDYETIHAIVNSSPVLHVSFVTPDEADPFPATIPMLGFMASYTEPNAPLTSTPDLYLHGYISSRLMRLSKDAPSSSEEEEYGGLPLTIAATHLDGLVLALTPNSHSYNYRSAVLHGSAAPVTDSAEKTWAMQQITNGVLSHRWENSRIPPTKTEMTSTQILRVKVVDASAKVRQGEPHDDRADMKNEEVRSKTWVGVVPTWTTYGAPVASSENRVAKVPGYISDFIDQKNDVGRKSALLAIHEPK